MSSAAKRISSTAVNWKNLSDFVTPKLAGYVAALKGQHSQFFEQVLTRPAELPKYDFDALKKRMPDYVSTLELLRKQYESLTIPYGKIPDGYLEEIEKWKKYIDALVKLHELKVADGAVEATKIEEKWARAPPLEHFTRDHFAEYFPKFFPDYRVEERIMDLYRIGLNERKDEWIWRFQDYKLLRHPDKPIH